MSGLGRFLKYSDCLYKQRLNDRFGGYLPFQAHLSLSVAMVGEDWNQPID